MTDRELMQQALEALECLYNDTEIMVTLNQHRVMKGAITDLRTALAEPEQEPLSLNNGRLTQYLDGSIGVGTPAEPEQEPYYGFGIDWGTGGGRPCCTIVKKLPNGVVEVVACEYGPAPTPRKPLTDEEIEDLYFDGFSISKLKDFARAIERAHGIKEQA